MDNILKIASEASKMLDRLENGTRYRISEVLGEFNKIADKNSSDLLVCNARDVLHKVSKKQEFITQREITEVYNSLYGLSGNRSIFKQALGGFLLSGHGEPPKSSANYSKNRDRHEVALEPMYEKQALAESFSTIFSLDGTPSIGQFNNGVEKKAEKFAKAQLNSMEHYPYSVKALDGNEHYILCVASFDTPSFTKVDVKIPVQVSGGIPKFPDSFIDGSSVEGLNKKNLTVYIKNAVNQVSKNSVHKFASERSLEFLRTEPAVLPTSLNQLADLDSHIVTATSKFEKREVDMGRNVVAAELKSMGLFNPQVKVSHCTDSDIVFAAHIKTASGIQEILIPVEVQNGSAILPSTFEHNSELYRFNSKNINKITKNSNHKSENITVRDSGSIGNMSYHELMDRVIDGVSGGDYGMSEEALITISNKFDGEKYKVALSTFTDILKASSKNTKREEMVKRAMNNGDLINIPTSVEPYSPKFGTPLSKLDFDEKGDLYLRRRTAKSENLKDSGSGISSYNIVLT